MRRGLNSGHFGTKCEPIWSLCSPRTSNSSAIVFSWFVFSWFVFVRLPKYGPHPSSIIVPAHSTPATTLTVIAMMITLKKKDTTPCSITSLRMLLDDTATSEVWQHMLNTTAKYVKSQ